MTEGYSTIAQLEPPPPTALPLINAHLSRSEQAMVINRLLVIHQLSLTLQTQLDQERLLRIMLSGITAGEALGFNRALVFLLDDSRQYLEGVLGVGPINEEECRHVWQTIAERGLTLSDFINEFGQLKRYQTAGLNIETHSIRWKIHEMDDIFTRTLDEKVCFHVTPDHYLDKIPPPLTCLLEVQDLVVAPLVVTGNALGLVVADNKFSGRPITQESIQLLSIVANQTAAALAHIRLINELERFQDHLEEKVREAVAEKERAQEEMIRRAKLATVGEMAVTVAHEIRNPLTAVRGFAQRLHRKYEDPERVHTYAEIIIQEVDRLNSVLGDVLDFARNVDTRIRPVNLNDLVTKTITLLEERFGKAQVICEPDLAPEIPTCYYDGTQLSQVLINLMKNGAQAMKEGGVLLVRTAISGDRLILEVTDTGEGIDEKHLRRIFEPFFTTKSKGTGLGLSLAKRVVEEHGGVIRVQTEVGKGTTFRIILPQRLEPPKVAEVITSLDRAKPLVDPEDPLTSSGGRVISV
jgi:signal transduction histidine kinase